MKYGYFDDENGEYVISTPKTPYPWINYLGYSDFFSLISNTAGGYAFYKDARLRRLTRYRYNNIPLDSNGRYFYIKDGTATWNPGWQPTKTKLDKYECRHGFGYTKINASKNGLSARVLYFVPVSCSAEVQMITLKNESQKAKKISLVSFVEWCLYNAQDDNTDFQRNFSTGEVEVFGSTICHTTEYRERRNHFAFYSVNAKIDGFDTDRESFLGLYNGLDKPETIENGKSNNSIADGWSPVASHRIELTLESGEEKTYVFLLGYVENPKDKKWDDLSTLPCKKTNAAEPPVNKEHVLALQKKFTSPDQVLDQYKLLKMSWQNILSNFTLKTGNAKLDRMAVWNQYQCVVTYNFARSASYFESGIGRGIGFRDTSQDMLGVVHSLPPKMLRERLYDVAATQFKDGSAYHQFQPLTKRGNADIGSNFNDDPLWLILGVSRYIKETGDTEFLNQMIPFDSDYSKQAAMYEHLKLSYNYILNHRGPHGLPLIGRADWNDCLNLNCFSTNPDDSFQTCVNKEGKTAESVMIAQMFVYVTDDYVQICRLKNDEAEAKKAQEESKKMEHIICTAGWDGQWYLRAYDDAGNKVGSDGCKDGKIFIETQGFGAMAQIGKEKGYPQKALDSVKKYLDTKYGIAICDPSYQQYHIELGGMTAYPPGYKENGGIFCHNNPWIMIGEIASGRPDDAFEHYKKIAPAFIEDVSDIHRTEPYVYSQMVAGKVSARFGEAKNSWLTGTASWNFVALSQYICGIKPQLNGLHIEPRLPSEIKSALITRRFRGVTYHISVQNVCNTGRVTLFATGENFQGVLHENVQIENLTVKIPQKAHDVYIKVCIG